MRRYDTSALVSAAVTDDSGKMVASIAFQSAVIDVKAGRALTVSGLGGWRLRRSSYPDFKWNGDFYDPAIPIVFGERLFALAREPKQFVRFPEGGHENLQNFGAIETARHFINAANG